MRLVVDVGGTNIRFALANEIGALFDVRKIPWEAASGFLDTMAAYVANVATGTEILEIRLAVAGPIQGNCVSLTNRPGVELRAEEICQRFGVKDVHLHNDLEAVALALPVLSRGDAAVLRKGAASPGATLLALNVGTGFGASAAVQSSGVWRAVPAEAGFMSITASSPEEAAFLSGCEVIEDYLSGRGLAELRALHPDHPMLEIGGEVFSRHLGRVAGDLVAGTGAWGGVFLIGGVADAWPAEGAALEAFVTAFNQRGLMRERFVRVPLLRIIHPNPALLGLAAR